MASDAPRLTTQTTTLLAPPLFLGQTCAATTDTLVLHDESTTRYDTLSAAELG